MALTSASTANEIIAEYTDNADYDIVGSTTKAKLFIHACRLLLTLRPSSTNVDGTSSAYDQKIVESQLTAALRWLQANGGRSGSRVASRRWDMRGMRS